MHKPYVIVTRDDLYFLVGPFESKTARAEWTKRHWDIGAGDPRWQSIDLLDAGAPPALFAPESAEAQAGI